MPTILNRSATLLVAFALVFAGAAPTRAAVADNQQLTALIQRQSDVSTLSTSTPPMISVGSGYQFSCGLTLNGAAYCWGRNDVGQLGNGSTNSSEQAVLVLGGLKFRNLAVGHSHSCATSAMNGKTYCWGLNNKGELGFSSTNNCTVGTIAFACSLTPKKVNTTQLFTSITVGVQYSCGLTKLGKAYCWGRNAVGQFGNGATSNGSQYSPTASGGTLSYRTLVASDHHTCGISTNSLTYCWGNNSHGELGRGKLSFFQFSGDSKSPVLVNINQRFSQLAIGRYHTCALTTTGTVFCWGSNGSGQLGSAGSDASFDGRRSPWPVSGGVGNAKKIIGGYEHTCALKHGGVLYCWGKNDSGQVGSNSKLESITKPTLVSGGHSWVDVSASGQFTVAVDSGGKRYFWGDLGSWCSSLVICFSGNPMKVPTLLP